MTKWLPRLSVGFRLQGGKLGSELEAFFTAEIAAGLDKYPPDKPAPRF
jgi:hypothetical protein